MEKNLQWHKALEHSVLFFIPAFFFIEVLLLYSLDLSQKGLFLAAPRDFVFRRYLCTSRTPPCVFLIQRETFDQKMEGGAGGSHFRVTGSRRQGKDQDKPPRQPPSAGLFNPV